MSVGAQWTSIEAPPGYDVEIDIGRPKGSVRHRRSGDTAWQEGPVPDRDLQRLKRQLLYRLEALDRIPPQRRRAEHADERSADIRAMLRLLGW